jgi:hypothetical protein
MARNLTIMVDDDLLAQYRLLAAQRKTSVNALLRKHMEEAIGAGERRKKAIERMIELSRASSERDEGRKPGGQPTENWHLSREDTYAERTWPRDR